MPARIDHIKTNFQRSVGTPVEHLAEAAVAANTDDEGFTNWAQAWADLRELAADQGLDHFIPGTVGREAAARKGISLSAAKAEADAEPEVITRELLEGESRKALVSRAKDLGVKANGPTEDLIGRILDQVEAA